MSGFSRCLLVGAVLAIVACSPPRPEFDSGPAIDTGPDLGFVDVREAGIDAVDAGRDVPVIRDVGGEIPCDDIACNDACIAQGFPTGGVCRINNSCFCFGVMTDSGMRADVPERRDVPIESSVIGCLTNAECPPTAFCNGAGCGTGPDAGRGFCSARGEADAASCEPEGPASCGCDGVLYRNVCARQSAGVRLGSGCASPTDAGGGG